MTKPLLLIDVDGVLCPFGKHYGGFDGYNIMPHDEVARLRNEELYDGYTFDDRYYVYISPDNKRRLKQLAQKFELVWCTGWQEKANEVIGPLHDLPELPVVQLLSFSRHVHWKIDGIEKFVGDRPYAFIDDDIWEEGIQYAEWRNKLIPTKWIKITCNVGLTDEHVAELEKFADSVINSPRAAA